MLRTTRIVALVIMPVLLAAWVILFLFPERTEELWAWTIRPRMTAMTMGAGYLGGVWFFYRVATARARHEVAGGLLAAFVFTALLGVATILHWSRFNHGHVSFWAWSFLYFASPLLLPFLYRANRAASQRTAEPPLPTWARNATVLVGAVQLLAAAVWFLAPAVAVAHWPWAVTPLTARTLASFVAFSGTLLLWVAVDPRYTSVRAGVEALTIGLVVEGVAAVAAISDFDGPAYSKVGYVLALVALLLLFATVRAAGTRGASLPRRAVGGEAGAAA